MKNICILNGDMSRGGGTERMTQVLANLLARNRNYSVTVVSLNYVAGRTVFPLDERVKFLILDEGSLTHKIRCLYSYTKKNHIDVLINVDIMLGIYSLPIALLNRSIKIVAWEMFNIRNDIGSRHTKVVRQLSLILSDYYVCLTKADMHAFQKEMHVKCPITFIYNPIHYSNYIGYCESSKKIITVGHFFYTKGFDLAVEVARYVFQRHPDWEWEFYGDGAELETVKELAQKYNLTRNIKFNGRTNDIMSVYKQCSMYVMTSRIEGFGLVLTEAKSCNLPTLAFDVEFGPREIIENDVSGYLVKSFDCKAMAEKICYLIENSDVRKRFSDHAKDNLDIFSIKNFIRAWENVLDQL